MRNWLFFIGTLIAVILLALLIVNITDRKAEARFAYAPKVEIGVDGIEPRDSIWGLNYPRQYQSYMQTSDTTYRSGFLSSGHRDALEEHPEYVILWAGYAFSKDYNQPKGHGHSVSDMHKTLRIGAPMEKGDGPMPSTCWTCKSPDVPRLMQEMGVTEFYSQKWSTFGSQVINPIGCADCHDPKTMNLTITRPALVEAFHNMGQDITQASHQEMRSLVCAQCHVEYYFAKDLPGKEGANYVVFPWKEGFAVEDMERYYDNIDFYDWEHPLSKAKMLKAQHPDYEMYRMGVHSARGVSCADCHMPYKSEGGQKFTDHHIGSPLNNIENSCFICHREKTDNLIADVYERQGKVKENMVVLVRDLAMAHIEAKKAWDMGATEAQMAGILKGIRHAQWRWDFVAATHGGSFHAPLESSRITSSALKIVGDARRELVILLNKLGHTGEVQMPDLNSKPALQAYIGLDMNQERANKQKFLDQVLPGWLAEGRQREAQMNVRKVSN